MDSDRLRREARDDLERLPDPPADARFDMVEAALRELAAAQLPPDEAIDQLLSRVEPVQRDEAPERVVDRVRRAAAALRAEAEPVGELLSRARRQANVSPEELGREADVDASLIRQIEEERGVGRLLNVPARNVAALTRRLGIAPQRFAASLARSIPQPSSFVYGYRPRQVRETPAEYPADEAGSRLLTWLEEYLSA